MTDTVETELHNPFYVGDWHVDPNTGRIQRRGAEVKLEPKAMQVLVCLAREPGKVISRETLEASVWAGTVVGYDALAGSIIKLRKALGDNSRNPHYIETVSKKGYRLIAQVSSQAPVTPADTGPGKDQQLSNAGAGWVYIKPAAAVLLLLLIVISWLSLSESPGERESTAKPASQATTEKASLVVLPFKNLSGNEQDEYFSDGITDDLMTDLSKLSGLLVIARRSAYIYKNRQLSMEELAKQLGVRYVVDGTVRRQQDQLRINVQLIDTVAGANIWAERFDRRTADLFQVQDDIRANIISALSVQLTAEEQSRNRRRYTASIEAYDYFLKGQAELVKRASAADNRKAQEMFETAIAIDPGFSRAMGALALSYADAFRFDWSEDPQQAAKQALELGQKARAMDSYSPQIHWVLGYVYLFVYEDHQQAITMGQRALDLDPNHADAYTLLGVTYLFANEYHKAITLVEQAKRLNPHYPSQYPSIIGIANLLLANYPQARKHIEESLLINAARVQGNTYLTILLQRMGEQDEAQWQYDQLLLNHPDFDPETWGKRQPYRDKQTTEALVSDLKAVCCQ